MARQHDAFARVLHRAGGLHEQHRILRDGGVAFLGVLPVVQADAENGGGLQRCQEPAGGHDRVGDAEATEKVALDAPGGAVGLKGCELDGAIGGLVADNAHGLLW